jgi:hypothetical protein
MIMIYHYHYDDLSHLLGSGTPLSVDDPGDYCRALVSPLVQSPCGYGARQEDERGRLRLKLIALRDDDQVMDDLQKNHGVTG